MLMARMWVEGKSPEEIAKALEKPVSAIFRILKKIIQGKVGAESRKERYPLRGTLLFYKDPTAPVGEDDWDAMK
jgi:hypothetical protein